MYILYCLCALVVAARSVHKHCDEFQREHDIYQVYANMLCERHCQVVIPAHEGDFAEKLIQKVEYRKEHPELDSWTMNDNEWWTTNKELLMNKYKERDEDYFTWDQPDTHDGGMLPANIDASCAENDAATDCAQTDIAMDNGASVNDVSHANNATAPSNPNSVGSQNVTDSLNTHNVDSGAAGDEENADNASSTGDNDEVTSTSDNGNVDVTNEKSVTPALVIQSQNAKQGNVNMHVSDISSDEPVYSENNEANNDDIDMKGNDNATGFPHVVLDNDKLDLSNADVSIRKVCCRLKPPFLPIVPKINHTWPYNEDTEKYNVKELNGKNIMNTGGKYGQAREGSDIYFRSSLCGSRRKFKLDKIHADSNESSGTLWSVTECKDNSKTTECSLNFSLLSSPRMSYLIYVFS